MSNLGSKLFLLGKLWGKKLELDEGDDITKRSELIDKLKFKGEEINDSHLFPPQIVYTVPKKFWLTKFENELNSEFSWN